VVLGKRKVLKIRCVSPSRRDFSAELSSDPEADLAERSHSPQISTSAPNALLSQFAFLKKPAKV